MFRLLSKGMRTLLWILLLLVAISSAPALAIETIVITVSEVPVYTSPSITSPVITVLKRGQQVPAGINPAGGFKKVLVLDATKKKIIGYVALADLKGGIFDTPADDQKKRRKSPQKRGLFTASDGTLP